MPGSARLRLTEADLAELRRLAAGGVRQAELAAQFGISQGQVSRVLSGARRPALPAIGNGRPPDSAPVAGSVSAAVAGFLEGRELDAAGQVFAAAARALAQQLDACAAAGSAAAATAAARLAAQLQETVRAIEPATGATAGTLN